MSSIPCRDGGTPRLGDAGDQRVAQIDHAARPLAIRSELSGCQGGHFVEGQHTIRQVFRQHPFERAFKAAAASSLREERQGDSSFEHGDAREPYGIGGLPI